MKIGAGACDPNVDLPMPSVPYKINRGGNGCLPR
jgi:hypothetical protein